MDSLVRFFMVCDFNDFALPIRTLCKHRPRQLDGALWIDRTHVFLSPRT